jgi:ATP-dependent Clp protease ATP-binding subunit ClpB
MIQSMNEKDYQVVKLAVMGEVKNHFRPEFINRIDEIVVFHALDEKNIADIARVQLKELERRVRAMEMDIEISDAAVAELAKAGFDPVYGARPLKRAIQQQLENPLSKAILEGRFGPKDTIQVDAKGGVFAFGKAKSKVKEKQTA